MLRVYSCITGEHDFRLVLVAAATCLLAAVTAFATLERARAAERRHAAWLGLAVFVSGTGIWSTHFVAMLAYQLNLPRNLRRACAAARNAPTRQNPTAMRPRERRGCGRPP